MCSWSVVHKDRDYQSVLPSFFFTFCYFLQIPSKIILAGCTRPREYKQKKVLLIKVLKGGFIAYFSLTTPQTCKRLTKTLFPVKATLKLIHNQYLL